jgi:beta-lactam-binding protein with PASTA domain
MPLNVTPTATFTLWTGGTVQTSGPPTSTFETSGPPTSTAVTVTVPNVIGLQKNDAIAAMRAVGLQLGSIGSDNQCIEPQGTVATQTPGAGPFVLLPGATFNLTVSSGHDSKGNPCTFR